MEQNRYRIEQKWLSREVHDEPKPREKEREGETRKGGLR